MSQAQSIDEIMARIRAQVQGRGGDATSGSQVSESGKPSSDVAQIMARIREQLKPESPPAGSTVTPEAGAPVQPLIPKLHDVARLRAETDSALLAHRQVGQLNPRPPGLHNRALQFVKKAMKRSLTWYTRPIHLFQGAVIRALQQVTAILQNHEDVLRRLAQESGRQSAALAEATRTELARLRETKLDREAGEKLRQELREEIVQTSANFTRQVASMGTQVGAIAGQLESVKDEIRQSALANRSKDRDWRRLLHAVETGNLAAAAPFQPVPPMFPSEIRHESEFDYFVFEDHHRGEERDIRERQSAYLELFRGRENVVDIGCGRGEFLELLRDNNISARGVELGVDQYLLCREKGLDVVQQDLFTFLQSVPDGSLGGLFSAQVIEHLTASDGLFFVTLAYRKCSAGSPVIFETINPESVYALVHNFFLDPTHVRPMHPGTLQFALESVGFRNVQVRFAAKVLDRQIPPLQLSGNDGNLQEFNRAIENLNDLVYGYQDYAAIGWK